MKQAPFRGPIIHHDVHASMLYGEVTLDGLDGLDSDYALAVQEGTGELFIICKGMAVDWFVSVHNPHANARQAEWEVTP